MFLSLYCTLRFAQVVNHEKEGTSAKFIHDKNGLHSISNDTEYVLGLFDASHCPYNIDIERNPKMKEIKPTLSEMTRAAINHLSRSNQNYFLFVEGARIDTAHHENWARIALDETKEFSKAIEIARNITDERDTLIVVTADHAHTMTYNGYTVSRLFIVHSTHTPHYFNYLWTSNVCIMYNSFTVENLISQTRGSDILGLSESNGSDGLPYTTLSYANGLGYYQTYDTTNGGRIDLSKFNLSNPRHRYPATVPLTSETHGGELIDAHEYLH